MDEAWVCAIGAHVMQAANPVHVRHLPTSSAAGSPLRWRYLMEMTMANPLLGQVLGSVFANAMRGRARGGPFAANAGGGLGGALGGMLGQGGVASAGRRGLGSNRGLLLALLLPYAMRWVQRNGGVGGVLDRFRQKGLASHADSWVSAGSNEPLRAEDADEVIGGEEISRVAHALGVPEREV